MARQWQVISEKEAKLHPLYGNKGWLVIFGCFVFNFVIDFFSLSSAVLFGDLSSYDYLGFDDHLVNLIKLKIFVYAVVALTVFWLMFKKSIHFRLVATVAIIAAMLVLFATTAATTVFRSTLNQNLIVFILNSAIWITYLHRSRRVRVTYEHKVLMPELNVKPQVSRQTGERIEPLNDHEDEKIWAQAASEVDGAGRRPGLWAKCFAQAQGDEIKTRVYYLKLRVAEMQDEQLQQLLMLEKQQQEQKQANELVRIAEAEKLRLITLQEAQRLHESLPKGRCSSCRQVIPLNSESCTKCNAMFGRYSTWTIEPL